MEWELKSEETFLDCWTVEDVANTILQNVRNYLSNDTS
jgi:hypothetical protein